MVTELLEILPENRARGIHSSMSFRERYRMPRSPRLRELLGDRSETQPPRLDGQPPQFLHASSADAEVLSVADHLDRLPAKEAARRIKSVDPPVAEVVLDLLGTNKHGQSGGTFRTTRLVTAAASKSIG